MSASDWFQWCCCCCCFFFRPIAKDEEDAAFVDDEDDKQQFFHMVFETSPDLCQTSASSSLDPLVDTSTKLNTRWTKPQRDTADTHHVVLWCVDDGVHSNSALINNYVKVDVAVSDDRLHWLLKALRNAHGQKRQRWENHTTTTTTTEARTREEDSQTPRWICHLTLVRLETQKPTTDDDVDLRRGRKTTGSIKTGVWEFVVYMFWMCFVCLSCLGYCV